MTVGLAQNLLNIEPHHTEMQRRENFLGKVKLITSLVKKQ